MSEEHKPHDEHAPEHPTPAADDHADHGSTELHEAPEVVQAVSGETLHEAPEAAAEPAHVDEPVEAAREEPAAHAEPVVAEAEPAHEPATEPVVEAAPAAAAASGKAPIWSDHGDAPFEDTESTPVYARKKGGKSGGGSGNETVEIFKTIIFALLIAMVLRIVLFQPFTIPSASMEPNLYEGDYIVVSKWSYGYSKHSLPWSPPLFEGRLFEQTPKRGDIVVFKLPSDNKTDYIKRLIGLPGDRIQMINNQLYLNGTVVPDVEVSRAEAADVYGSRMVTRFKETLPEGKTFNAQEWGPGFELDQTEVFTVPDGYYFMIGDNRDNSLDSRARPEVGGVGLVPAENLIGKAEIILFSWSPGASLWNPISWFSKVRPSRFFTVLH